MNKLISIHSYTHLMSLDKFLTDSKSKKKKKSKSDLKPEKNLEHIDDKESKLDSTVNMFNSVDQGIGGKVEENFTVSNHSVLEEVQGTSSENDITIDSRISVPEFQDKSKFELFQIILDIVHSSPLYSRNKNLIAKYLQDHNQEIDIDYLTEQLDLSYNELFVLLSEIKQDFK